MTPRDALTQKQRDDNFAFTLQGSGSLNETGQVLVRLWNRAIIAESLPAPDPAPLDVERLAVAFQRAWLWCDQHHPAGWSQTGDLVPAIAREYAALASEDRS